MCGIAGIAMKNGALPDEGLLRRMSGALAHRGPDGEGVWTGPGIGLAHRRLSIIDLDRRASQPMAADGLAIVFNGEIYNYRELRAELKGVSWKTESDTEAVLEGYRAWGEDVVKHLRGMFAFAIWDASKRQLFVARDRIGKKPLFLARTRDGGLVFASEIKAFAGIVDLKPDWDAIRLFLGLQYVPSPKTGFLGVEQLKPGYVGVWNDGTWGTRRYHDPSSVPGTQDTARTDADIDADIRSRLEDAVKVRMLAADVPVGAFLSGGVDSAAVVAYATKYAEKPLQTFTMGFPSLAHDERVEAEEIAKHFKTDHRAFEAKPDDLLALVDTLVGHYDAPYADSSALPLWLLAKETSKHVKVVLTGDGGDETFGGYRRYVAFDQAARLSRIPFAGAFTRAVGALTRDARYRRMADSVDACHAGSGRAYGEMFCGSYFNSRSIADLCTSDFLKTTGTADAVAFVAARMKSEGGRMGPPLQRAMLFDLISYLPDDLNVKMDRATMAFGLEARAPFLDQDLVAMSMGLPLNQKVNHGRTKVALKRALHGIVPENVLNRPKKGFQVPLADWFRGPLRSLIQERCLDTSSPLAGFMNMNAIQRLVDENSAGSDHGNRLWMLLTLATWLERYA
ncbi:MAG: asparagine synthase (glutamine-hydrolyzing) [Patescibacteria group bacterium]